MARPFPARSPQASAMSPVTQAALATSTHHDQERRDYYTYSTTLTSIPAQGQSTGSFRIDADADFVVQFILCSACVAPGVAFRTRSNLVGTIATGAETNGVGQSPTGNFESVQVADSPKLYRDGQPNAAQVSNFGLHLVRLAFSDNNRNWQNEPIRADLIASEPGRMLFLPQPQRVAANSNLVVVAYSDIPSGAADGSGNTSRGWLNAAPPINVQVALGGYKLYRA